MAAIWNLIVNSFTSLELNINVAQIFGVPLFLRESSRCRRYGVLFYCIVFAVLFNGCYFCCEVLDLIHIEDMSDITQNGCLTFTHLGGNIKVFNVMVKMQEIKSLVEAMREFPNQFVTKEDHRRIYRRSELENKLIVIIYSSIVMITAFLGFGILLKDPTIGGKKFPYRALLPDFLPESVRVPYWSISATMLAIQNVSIDCLNVNLINQIRLHLKLLNLDLSRLVIEKEAEQNPMDTLKECIKHHQLILRLRDDIDRIFKYPVLVQFLVSLFIFVTTGFQAIVVSGSDEILIVYFYCGCILCQLFSYCWFANQVMEENKHLVIAGYNTSWPQYGVKYSKLLLIFMINAQRPLTFTVGGFFNLSLNAFTGILSRSYSTIAVLRQMYAN